MLGISALGQTALGQLPFTTTLVTLIAGSYNYSGNEITSGTGFIVGLPASSYSLIGESSTPKYEIRLQTDSFTLTGEEIKLAFRLGSSSYDLTGNEITVLEQYNLQSGAFGDTGNKVNYGWVIDSSFYTELGYNVTTNLGNLPSGAFTLDGSSSTFSYSWNISNGAYSLNGESISILFLVKINLPSGTYSLLSPDIPKPTIKYPIFSSSYSIEGNGVNPGGNFIDLVSSQYNTTLFSISYSYHPSPPYKISNLNTSLMQTLGTINNEQLLYDFSDTGDYYYQIGEVLYKVSPAYAFRWFQYRKGKNIIYNPFINPFPPTGYSNLI